MSQAEELLNSLSTGEVQTIEEHVVIGQDRFITVPNGLKRIAVEHDHDVKTVTFDCPRYWDGRDLTTMKLYINYIRGDKQPGSYPIDNGVTVDAVDSNIIHFDWVIKREVTEFKGNISFLVCARKVDSEGMEVNHWNSELNKDMTVSEGLEAEETIASEYPDLITYLLTRMDIVENKTTLQSMLNYLDTYFTTDAKINEVLQNYVSEYLTSSDEVTQAIADTVNAYIDEYLSATDKTLTISEMPADAAATGDAIRNTVKVTNDTSVTDSVAGPLKLNKLFGKSVQEKTSGYQLLPLNEQTLSYDGLTLTVKGSNITIKGTPTKTEGYISFTLGRINLKAGTYTHRTDNKVVGIGVSFHSVPALNFAMSETITTKTHTLSSDVETTVVVNVDNTRGVVDYSGNWMLNAGTEALPWEPYTGGQASPNPEYPQPIVSAGQKLIGNQLIEPKLQSATLNGITLTHNGNGVYVINGEATAEATFRIDQSVFNGIDNLKNYDGTYTISVDRNADGNVYAFLMQEGTWSTKVRSDNIPSGTFTAEKCFVCIGVKAGAKLSNYVVKSMLNKGSTALPWEPYTGGVKKAYDTGINGKVVRKNLLDVVDLICTTFDKATGTIKSITTNNTGQNVKALMYKGSEYIDVCFNVTKVGSNQFGFVKHSGYDVMKIGFNGDKQDAVIVCDISHFKNGASYKLLFTVDSLSQNASSMSGVMVVEDSVTDYTYESYTEQSLAFPIVNGLRGIPVTDASLANYVDAEGQMWCSDYVDTERGVLVERIGKSVFTGDDVAWYINAAWETDNTMAFYTTPPGVYYNPAIAAFVDTTFCSHYIHKNVGFGSIDEECFRIANTIMYIKVRKDRLSSADINGLKTYLSTIDPIEVSYILATPIETPLTREQLLAVRDLMAGEGGTNLFFNEVAPGIEMEYPRTLAASHTLQNQKELKLHNDPYRDVVITDEDIITIDDAAAGGMKVVDMFGKSVQEKTSGKNLLNIEVNSHSKSNVSMTVNGDGSITLDGKTTGVADFTISNQTFEIGNYIMSSQNTLPTNAFLSAYLTNGKDVAVTGNNTEVAISNEYQITKVHLWIGEGVTFNNLTLYPMIRKSDVIDGTFEPYTNGPTPNPEYPQPIVSAGQKLASGKNLAKSIKVDADKLGQYEIALMVDADLKPSTTYTLSFVGKQGNVYTTNEYLFTEGTWITATNGITTVTLTTPANIEETQYISGSGWYILKNATANNSTHVFTDVMLNEGSTALPWEPYTGGVKKAVDVGIQKKLTGKKFIFGLHLAGSIYYESEEVMLDAGNYVMTLYNKSTSNNIRLHLDKKINGSFSMADYKIISKETRGSIAFTLTEPTIVKMSGRYESSAAFTLSDVHEPMIAEGPEQTIHLDRVLRGIPVTDSTLANYTDVNGQMWCADEIDLDREIYVGNLLENTATTQTKNGGTFTVNADGSVTVNGTFSADTSIMLSDNIPAVKKGENYILSGCPSGGAGHTYVLSFAQYKSDGAHILDLQDIGTGKNISLSSDCATTKMFIWIASGQTFNNVTFYPMIRPVEIDGIPTSAAYVPYSYGKFTKKSGVLVERIGHGTLPKSGWTLDTDASDYIEVACTSSSPVQDSTIRLVSTHFGQVASNNRLLYRYGNFYARVPKSSTITTFDDAVRFMANNNSEYFGILATPILKALTDEEILMLHQLKTNHSITHIYGSNDPAPDTRFRYGVTDVAGLSLENSNLNVVNEVLIAKNEGLLAELNTALPFKIVIDDAAGTINFIDR